LLVVQMIFPVTGKSSQQKTSTRREHFGRSAKARLEKHNFILQV
jgi:hypothetical protein